MPQSANDQVEHHRTDEAPILVSFQCLSRQTIKWNEPLHRRADDLGYRFNASVGKRSSGTGRAAVARLEYGTVSMPQSANDQVELAGLGGSKTPEK